MTDRDIQTISEAVDRLDDEGVEQLRRLREQRAALAARQDQERAQLDEEVQIAERRFADAEATRQHAEQLAAARAEYEEQLDAYRALDATAAGLIADLNTATATVIEAFASAVDAERRRHQAVPALVGARQRLADLGDTVPEPHLEQLRLHALDARTDPVAGIAMAALAARPELESASGAVAKRPRIDPRTAVSVRLHN